MKALIICEIMKTLAWVFILFIVIQKRKKITVNIFWVTAISAVLMILAGLQDIFNYHSLEEKSILWLMASGFVITNYIIMIRTCCKESKISETKINEFIEKIEQDKKTLL